MQKEANERQRHVTPKSRRKFCYTPSRQKQQCTHQCTAPCKRFASRTPAEQNPQGKPTSMLPKTTLAAQAAKSQKEATKRLTHMPPKFFLISAIKSPPDK
eukprot:2866554-Amphidinium_carterae.1